MLVKEIEKHEVYSIILKFLCYAFFFVLLESCGRPKYAETPNAFIFSLNNSEGLAPFVSKVTPDKTARAIQRRSDTGPKFATDLIIYLDAGSISKSRAVLGSYYPAPASVKDGDTVLKGPGSTFSPDEVEVFYLDPYH